LNDKDKFKKFVEKWNNCVTMLNDVNVVTITRREEKEYATINVK
jgi:hypothetical protein